MYKPKPPNSVTVIVITTITIIFWVFFGVYRILTSQPDPEVPPEILAPLDPTLNSSALDKIEESIYFLEEDLLNFPEGDIIDVIVETDTEEEEVIEENTEEETAEEEESENTTPTPTPEEQTEGDLTEDN